MIEVIKHGKKKFTATCTNCGCEFTYELSDMRPLGGIDCPDCGHHVAHQNFGNNNGSLYYPLNCRGIQDMPDITVFTTTGTESKPEDNKAELTTTDTDKSAVVGSLYSTQGDVYTTEQDLEIQQMFKEQMSKKEPIPCDDFAQEQLKRDAYRWMTQKSNCLE